MTENSDKAVEAHLYRKKPVVIEATQWFKNGDHPKDGDERFDSGEFKGELFEGAIVRYFRRPDIDGEAECRRCRVRMHDHGWIDTLEGGHIVCPGDWVITGVKGEHYPCKPDIFAATYESAALPHLGAAGVAVPATIDEAPPAAEPGELAAWTEAQIEWAVEIVTEHLEIDGDDERSFVRFDSIDAAVRAIAAFTTPPVPQEAEPLADAIMLAKFSAIMRDLSTLSSWVESMQRGVADVIATTAPVPQEALPLDRDTLGRMVREAWVRWAMTQPSPKPSWLLPYDELAEPDKEADRQIGEAIAKWTVIHYEARAALAPVPQEATAEPVATGVEFYKAVNARNNHSGRGLAFDGGCLNLRKDGSGEFVFDRDAEIVSEEGKDLLIARIPASEIEFLRNYLAGAFPAAAPVPQEATAEPVARLIAYIDAIDALPGAAANFPDDRFVAHGDKVGGFTFGDLRQLRASPPSHDAELLAARDALRAVLGWIDNWDPNFIWDDEWPATRKAADAALAPAASQEGR